MSEPKAKVTFSIAAQVVAWLAGIFLAYGAMNARVSVLEDRVNRFATDIQEIKQDVKTLLLRK